MLLCLCQRTKRCHHLVPGCCLMSRCSSQDRLDKLMLCQCGAVVDVSDIRHECQTAWRQQVRIQDPEYRNCIICITCAVVADAVNHCSTIRRSRKCWRLGHDLKNCGKLF